MSSINTNTGAMIALQAMRSLNTRMGTVQSEIATGKSVASARDNAAVWAISKVMESDVTGFKAIGDNLALGSSTVTVARNAAESITDLLIQMKDKIVSAQGENVDRAKIQSDVDALRAQVSSVINTAQFNGLNLVDGSQSTVDMLSSLDRSTSAVTASSITITAQDLSTGGYVAESVFDSSTGGTISSAGDNIALAIDAGAQDDFTIQNQGNWAAGDKITLRLGDKTASYTVTDADIAGSSTVDDLVAMGLKNAIDKLGIDGLTVDYDSANPGQLVFNNDGSADLSISGQYRNAGSGGLGLLSGIDVTTQGNAKQALGNIEELIQTAINAAAEFGSVGKRIDTQANFVSNLTDALQAGIGSLVDADMEEASARLQALQVQQQIGIQALAIANQAPQNLLQLFR